MSSPLTDDANATLAASIAREPSGPLLAIYASIRSTTRVTDPLVGLGLPLLAYVLATADDTPTRVTAQRDRHSANSPLLGLGTDVELWTLLIRCASEMTITVDVAAGPWTTAVGPVELRVEWMRPGRVTTLHPRGARMSGGRSADPSLGLTGLEERLLNYAIDVGDAVAEGIVPDELAGAMSVIGAARASASTGGPVEI